MVHTVKNKIFPSNTYIVAKEDNKECLLVDPGLDCEAIDEKLDELNLRPHSILATHGHFDHVGSVSFFQKKYDANFYIHELDVKILRSINFFLKVMKIDMRVAIPVPDVVLRGANEKVYLKDHEIEAYNFAGHTDGSCLFKINDCLFSGDTLYSNGIGVNPFPGQDKLKLRASLKEIVELFSEDILVYPGHGSSEILSKIKADNNELLLFLEPS